MAVEIKWQHVTTDFISWRLYGMCKSVGAPPKFTNWMLQTVKNALFLFFNSEFSSHPTDAKKTIDHKPRGSQGSQYTQSH